MFAARVRDGFQQFNKREQVRLSEQMLPVFFWQGPKHPTFCDTIHLGRLLLEKIRIGFFYLIFFGAFVSQQ